MPQKLTDEIIDAAIEGFESQKVRIDQKIAELRAIRSGDHAGTAVNPETAPRKRSKFSAAARKRMALAQKARWEKIRNESEPAQPAAAPTKLKRKLSAAAKAKLVANLKKARAAKAAKAGKRTVIAKKTARRKTEGKKSAPAAASAAAQTV